MIKTIVPSLLLMGAVTAQGADQAGNEKLLGFEFGVGYHLVDDRRYDGTDANFGLVLPMGQRFDAVVYHEVGRYYGKQDGDRSQIEADANELRLRFIAWDGETQALRIFLGLGYQDLNVDDGDDEVSRFVADAGIVLTAMKTKSGPVKGEISLSATYRYYRFSQIFGELNDELTKLGGFIIGVNAGLYF